MIGENLLRRCEDGRLRVDGVVHNSLEDETLIESLEQPVSGFSLLVTEVAGFPERAYFLPLFGSGSDPIPFYPVWTPTLRVLIRPTDKFDVARGNLFATCILGGGYLYIDTICRSSERPSIATYVVARIPVVFDLHRCSGRHQ